MSHSGLSLRLDQITRRAEELRALLETAQGSQVAALSRELSNLDPIVEKIAAWRAAETAQAEAQAMLADPEMRELAEAELAETSARLPVLEREIRLALLPKDEADARSATAQAPLVLPLRWPGTPWPRARR